MAVCGLRVCFLRESVLADLGAMWGGSIPWRPKFRCPKVAAIFHGHLLVKITRYAVSGRYLQGAIARENILILAGGGPEAEFHGSSLYFTVPAPVSRVRPFVSRFQPLFHGSEGQFIR